MFALNKELTILIRDKILIEEEIIKAKDRIGQVDTKMMGC